MYSSQVGPVLQYGQAVASPPMAVAHDGTVTANQNHQVTECTKYRNRKMHNLHDSHHQMTFTNRILRWKNWILDVLTASMSRSLREPLYSRRRSEVIGWQWWLTITAGASPAVCAVAVIADLVNDTRRSVQTWVPVTDYREIRMRNLTANICSRWWHERCIVAEERRSREINCETLK